MQDDIDLIRNRRNWPGETLCLKKRPKPGEKAGFTGYSEFGVITTSQLPIVIYLRPDFINELRYETIEEMLEDGWMVD